MEQLNKSPINGSQNLSDEVPNFSMTVEQYLQKNTDRVYRLNVEIERSYFTTSILKTKISIYHSKINNLPKNNDGYKLAITYFDGVKSIFNETMQLFVKSKNDISELKGLVNSSKCAFNSYKPAKELEKCENEKTQKSVDLDNISYS